MNEFGMPLLLPEKLRILMPWLTLIICLTAALDLNLQVHVREDLLRRKKVSSSL